MMSISPKANIGDNVTIKDGVIIEDNVTIGDDSYVDYGAIIKENVYIGNGCFIGARCILGEFVGTFFNDRVNKVHELHIGDRAIIRSETIIYGDVNIGENFSTGHRVTIREGAVIGNNVSVGTLVDIQGYCKIGNYTRLHSNVHIGQKSVIGNYVWIFPYVVLTNDPIPPSNKLYGVTVEDFAVICTQSTILPGVTIGKDSLIGAGSIVGKDVACESIIIGNPAKNIGHISKLKDANGGSHYPWKYNFDRGMPWSDIGYDKWSSR